MISKRAKAPRQYKIFYCGAAALSLFYVLIALYQLTPKELSFPELLNMGISEPNLIYKADWPWSKMAFSERGDFVAGFFAPLALIWALVALILQQTSLNLQQQELKGQTEIFNEELRNQRRSDWRNQLHNSERYLQRHSNMIHKTLDWNYKRDKDDQFSELDAEKCNHQLNKVNQKAIQSWSMDRIELLINRMCFYKARLEKLEKTAEKYDLIPEFDDFKFYTPYGHLYMTCQKKLNYLKECGHIESNNWTYNINKKRWDLKTDYEFHEEDNKNVA